MRRSIFSRTVVVVLTIASIAGYAIGATVNIEVNTMHQKISGFGTCSAWNGTLTAKEGEQLWSITKGAGLSLHRVQVVKDGLDNDEINNTKLATSYGVKVWGTPWYCKNGVKAPGKDYDTLYEKDYQAWAEVLAATAKKMKDMGAPLYAISSGNEIDIGSTKYNQQALATWVGKYMGPTLSSKAPDVKVMGVETCNWYGFEGYLNYFKNDQDAWKYSSILATHEYGGNPKAYPEINAAGKEFWQTEIFDDHGNVEDPGMGSALRTSKLIHDALTIANMNAWHFWWIKPCSGCANGALWAEATKQPTKRLWIMGNWSRYVRPGFVRIEATKVPTSGVSITAFRDSALNRVVIVAINENNSSISQDFTISGTTPLQLTPCITDPSRDLVEQSTQTLSSSSFSYSLPAQSATTLVIDLKITPVEPRSAFEKIESESYNLQSGVQIETNSDGVTSIGFIKNESYVGYRSIDFGSGAEGFQARVGSGSSGGDIQIILDSITGTMAGTCRVSSTGGWQTWETVTCNINKISGKHDVYLKFTGTDEYLMNVNWFQFTAENVGAERTIMFSKKGNFRTNISGGNFVITPADNSPYSISVYKFDGRFVASMENVTGKTTIPVRSKGSFVINIKSKWHVEKKKIFVN